MSDTFGTELLSSNQGVVAERALVRELVRDRSRRWRRHGIGVLQTYVREAKQNEVRVHIWHPTLVREGIAHQGDVHDHRFTLESRVLQGAIHHEELAVEEDPEGEWDVLQVKHARQNPSGEFSPRRIDTVPGPLVDTAIRARSINYDYEFREGATYLFRRGFFHRTYVTDIAVTLITKTDQIDAGARILSRHGSPAVAAFDPRDDDDPEVTATIGRVLMEAEEALW